MLKMGTKALISIIVVIILCTCIDTYTPILEGYKSLLVVDGLITDENVSNTIKLSRTIQQQDAISLKVSDASLYITDENGNSSELLNKGEGIYKTDSTTFRGYTGKVYTLHIITNEGEEYESEPCKMQSVPGIDSIYYFKEQELINNGTETDDGIRIYLDSENGDNKYFRWGFEEVWQFRVPNPQKFNYINQYTVIPVDNVYEFCWKTRKSDDLLIDAIYSGESGSIEKEPISFIAANKSDRLLLNYTITISQYSVSEDEFGFWDNLKNVSEVGEDIFAGNKNPG